MNKFTWNSCPLCGSNLIHSLGDISYRLPIMFSTNAIELERTPELNECKGCKSWFTQNIICEDAAYEMYRQGESSRKWPRNVIFEDEKHPNITRRLSKYFIKGKKVLDIGCNTGILLDFAYKKGCFTAGVEPSLASIDVLQKKGHVVFPSIQSVTEKYDVITAFDLVEHLYDLPSFFKMVENLLNDNGVFILLTGDICSLSARLTKKCWWYIKAPEHIVFPSRGFLKNIKVLKFVSIDSTYASVGYDFPVIRRITQYILLLLYRRRYEGLPSLGPDHMLVTLKKIKRK